MGHIPSSIQLFNVQKMVSQHSVIAGQASRPVVLKPQQPDSVFFSGNKQKAIDAPKIDTPWYKKTATKIISGSLLLAGGLGLKLLGIATVVGMPVLVPIAIGMAGVGLALAGWGVIQAFKKDKTATVPTDDSSKPPVTLKTLLDEITQAVNDDLLEGRESSRETLKKFGATEKELDDLRLQLEAEKVQKNYKSTLHSELVQRILKSKSKDEIIEGYMTYKAEKVNKMLSVI